MTTIKDVRAGDTLKVTRTFEVSRTDTADGVVYAKGGGKIRLSSGYWGSEAPIYDFEIVKTTPKHPDHWPAQMDDVWEMDGSLYHVVATNYGSGVPAEVMHSTKGRYNLQKIDSLNAKLVYRKGNVLK